MSKLRDPRHRHDAFFRKARGAGFAARSVYKLEEIDQQPAAAARRATGCSTSAAGPGSWLQYALKVVGPHGAVVGHRPRPAAAADPGRARAARRHLRRPPTRSCWATLAAFDVVLSDMAPDTTGVRATDQARSAALFEEALARAERLLAPGGAFVGKIFQGPDVEVLRKRMAGALLATCAS